MNRPEKKPIATGKTIGGTGTSDANVAPASGASASATSSTREGVVAVRKRVEDRGPQAAPARQRRQPLDSTRPAQGGEPAGDGREERDAGERNREPGRHLQLGQRPENISRWPVMAKPVPCSTRDSARWSTHSGSEATAPQDSQRMWS